MAQFFKAIFGGISFLIIYIIVIMCTPIVLSILGYSDVDSKPTILKYPLYVIQVREDEFFSEATTAGLLLSFIFGIILYYLFLLLIPKKWKQ